MGLLKLLKRVFGRRKLTFQNSVQYLKDELKERGISDESFEYILIIAGENGFIPFYHDDGIIDFDSHIHLEPAPWWGRDSDRVGPYRNVRLSRADLDKVVADRAQLVTRWNKRVRLYSGPDEKKGWR